MHVHMYTCMYMIDTQSHFFFIFVIYMLLILICASIWFCFVCEVYCIICVTCSMLRAFLLYVIIRELYTCLHAWHADLYIKNVWGVYFFQNVYLCLWNQGWGSDAWVLCVCHLFIGKCSMCDTCTETAGV